MKAALLLALALSSCSCAAARTAEPHFWLPLGQEDGSFTIERIEPRPEWRQAFSEVRECAGLQTMVGREFDDIRWWVISRPISAKGRSILGEFDGHRGILLSAGAMDDIVVVKHEMLHYLLPHLVHPRLWFRERCDLDPFGQAN